MDILEQKIIESYIPFETSLRDIAILLNTNHKLVGRVLRRNEIEVVKAKAKPMTSNHKQKISKALIGRESWSTGKKMPIDSIYKNMATHLRWDISYEWLKQFDNLEKLKVLNKSITRTRDMPNITTEFYKEYILKFYSDLQFNTIYETWEKNGRRKLQKPSLDHITPKSRGGSNELTNLQFLTWFENFTKRDMTQNEWEIVKSSLNEYFI